MEGGRDEWTDGSREGGGRKGQMVGDQAGGRALMPCSGMVVVESEGSKRQS